MDAPKRAVIYTRISRDDSGDGRTNQRQEEDGRALARMRGWEVVDVVNDISISAYSGKTRPGWETVKQMMSDRTVDVVIAWKLDRVTRTVKELTNIITLSRETNVAIVTTEGDFDLASEAGKMMATVLGAVAEMEVERKGARQKRANQQRREEGKRWSSGWRPFGYLIDGTIVAEEANLIRVAADDVLSGTPIREIARRWRETGVVTPRSKKGADGWTHNGVRQILLNPRNAALQTYKGEVTGKGDWEPIVSEETHVRLRSLLTDPARRTHGGRLATNLLSGIAVCAVCEETVSGGTKGVQKSVDGRRVTTGRVAVYKCPYDHLSANREQVDDLVITAFQLSMTISVNTNQLMPLDRKGPDVAALEGEANRIGEEIDGLADSYASRRITLSQMERATSALRVQLDGIQRAISTAFENDTDVRTLVKENVDRFGSMTTEERRAILNRVARIRLYPKGRGRRNVPIKYQVEMDLVTYDKEGEERLVPALRERPKDLPDIASDKQDRKRARGDVAGRL